MILSLAFGLSIFLTAHSQESPIPSWIRTTSSWWSTSQISDDEFIKDDFPGAGENIRLVGGSKIITSFLNQEAVDEIIISVIPILLGKGMPLFKNIENETKLELVKTVKY